jgi:hypothetical protein
MDIRQASDMALIEELRRRDIAVVAVTSFDLRMDHDADAGLADWLLRYRRQRLETLMEDAIVEDVRDLLHTSGTAYEDAKEVFIVELARKDAMEYVDNVDNGDPGDPDADFTTDGIDDWACCDGQFEDSMHAAAFAVEDGDKVEYVRLLTAEAEALFASGRRAGAV